MLDHTIEENGYRYIARVDQDPINPREDHDNAATMLCWHGRYNLGDEHNWPEPHYAVADLLNIDMEEYVSKYQKASDALKDVSAVVLPLYLYDHSGITMSTTPFSCPWDSGQVGFIYITYEKLSKEFQIENAGKDWKPDDDQRKKCIELLKCEVSTYDDYLTGNVWICEMQRAVEGDEGWETVEAVGGFIGNPDDCLRQFKEEYDG